MTNIIQIPTPHAVHKTQSFELYEPPVRLYIHGAYEKTINSNGIVREINYISTPSGLSAINVKEKGILLQRFTYTPWGSRQLTLDNTGTSKPL